METKKRKRKEPLVYSERSVNEILEAYHHVFRHAGDDVFAYLGVDRQRPWSYVSTDFRTATYERCRALHDLSVQTRASGASKAEQADAIKAYSLHQGVGFSLGICPWTDSLLFETFVPTKTDLVIVVGGDTYPIAAGDYADSPLYVDGLHVTRRYCRWCPDQFFDRAAGPVVLFVNLYPDYRPPAAEKLGDFDRVMQKSECADGLASIVRICEHQYTRIRVISWGGYAWDALRPRLDGSPRVDKQVTKQAQGMALGEAPPLRLFGHPYLPMAHPSARTISHNHDHLRRGYEALGIGRPQFDVWREIAARAV